MTQNALFNDVPNEKVGRFEIPVHNAAFVQVVGTEQQHFHVFLDLTGLERVLIVLNDLAEVRGHKLKDQDKAKALRKDVVQPDHVFMIQSLKKGQDDLNQY